MRRTLGGERIGSGNKMKVDMHTYDRSTHDLGYLWRSTMSFGTIVPFLKNIAQPGDTWDINLNMVIMTHPTVGPLFGSAKVQADIYTADFRLYNGKLHNNEVGLGLKMNTVKFPQMTLTALPITDDVKDSPGFDINTWQINPSALLAYLGTRGVGQAAPDGDPLTRNFQAMFLLAYWETVKNYYSNKQEELGRMIWTAPAAIVDNLLSVVVNAANIIGQTITHPVLVEVNYTGPGPFKPSSYNIQTSAGQFNLDDVLELVADDDAGFATYNWRWTVTGTVTVISITVLAPGDIPNTTIHVEPYRLSTIDDMRKAILAWAPQAAAFNVNTAATAIDNDNPYSKILDVVVAGGNTYTPYTSSQQGLALKTYQSDLFNNWLSTEAIDGAGGINDITKISTTDGFIMVDTIILHKKIYDMLNRISVSGGSYKDWRDATYQETNFDQAESPVYHGSLIKELIFQEVVSNSESQGEAGTQPLGTLAGRGLLGSKHKGGKITIKPNEWCVVLGLVSVTPRIDYSQGNDWDVFLETMDDLHKPQLDEIGFQELLQRQMAWWTSRSNDGILWTEVSTGKQPAWINYMTAVNKVLGNFAIQSNEGFMVFQRQYEWDPAVLGIVDMTTYIDPVKYNHIFAQTSLDAQNLWVQMSVDIECRRLMSAKLMPNL